jgi:NCAIR mutase (PurE)-related protein
VQHIESVDGVARLDPDRLRRKGVPEVIYAPGKVPDVLAGLAWRLVEKSGQALVSRVGPDHELALRAMAHEQGLAVEEFGGARRLRRENGKPAAKGGAHHGAVVGLLAAGTSDIDVAEEARMVAESMGVGVVAAYDVGIAAVHRLSQPLQEITERGADAIVVVAGMEGALPTLVASLVTVPVIAVPTSTGYGAGGSGLAALLSMLQTCSPGLTLVNIDNGIGAGAAAGLIALRVARARAGSDAGV